MVKRDVNPIARRIFGKSIVAKLTRITTGNIGAITDWDTVYGLANVLSTSPDWPYYRDSFGMLNMLHVTVKVYPQCFPFNAGTDRVAGICYDLKDSVALSGLQGVCDHKQHIVMNFGSNGAPSYVFSTQLKPIGVTPISTAALQENWGWIKAYADNNDFGAVSISICRIEFIFTVAFSSEQ